MTIILKKALIMHPQNYLFDYDNILVIDTSVIINLNSSGFVEKILSDINCKIVIPEIAANELIGGAKIGKTDHLILDALISKKLVTKMTLEEDAESVFISLVAGEGSKTIDDGEAATIAIAHQINGCVVLDDKKAEKLCKIICPNLKIFSTVDLFREVCNLTPNNQSYVGEAIYNSLVNARMRVPEHHLDWVSSVVGVNRIRACNSLPMSFRNALIV